MSNNATAQDSPLITVTLTRTGEVFTDSFNAQGEWAVIEVGSCRFDAIERVGGYIRLRSGASYPLFGYKSPKLGRVLRPVHDLQAQGGGIAKIRIHAANFPHQLSGCIAPGRRDTKKNKLMESGKALEDIFTQLGGWKDGAAMGTLTVK